MITIITVATNMATKAVSKPCSEFRVQNSLFWLYNKYTI